MTSIALALLLSLQAYTVADTYAALDQVAATSGVSYARLERIVGCETGHTMDPYSVGDHGTSFGPVQLHHGGELERFYAVGYDDPYSPYQAIEYLAEAILEGRASRWTCR